MSITLNTADAEVSEALIAEIDSIKDVTKETTEATYAPQAWNRQGKTD